MDFRAYHPSGDAGFTQSVLYPYYVQGSLPSWAIDILSLLFNKYRHISKKAHQERNKGVGRVCVI